MQYIEYTESLPIINNEEEATLAIKPWRFPTLFKYDTKAKKRLWRIMFDGSSLITEHGIVGGKIVRSETIVKLNTRSKNLSHQAYVNANGKYTKKVKEGMMLKDAISAVVPGTYDLPRGKIAMLAYHYTDGRIEDDKERFSVQRKYDGLRCRARLSDDENGTVELIKRGGDPIAYCSLLKSVACFMLKNLPKGWQLDGELYRHGMSLQQIESIVNRSVNVHEDENKLLFYVFDLIPPNVNTPNALYIQRRQMLVNVFKTIKGTALERMIRLAKEYTCTNMKQVDQLHDRFLHEGYEGAVIRKWNCVYVTSRSYNIMKYVEFKSVEATIVGFDKAKGTEEGAIIFRIRLDGGLEQGVRPMGNMEKRRKMYLRGTDFINRGCTVRFKDYTPAGKLHAPVLFKID